MSYLDVRTSILNKLMLSESTTYSELEKVADNHDLFNYHLKELQKKGLIDKIDGKYCLTMVGRQNVALMEEDGQYQKQFSVGLFINPVRKVGDKYEMLLYKRLKHPHYGYYGAVSCKLRWGDSIYDNLVRELDEELGIFPLEFTNLGVRRDIFRNEKGEIMRDGVYFVYILTKWKGEPAKTSIEGEYEWFELDKILDIDKIFRNAFTFGIQQVKNYLGNPEKYMPYVVEETNENEKLKF